MGCMFRPASVLERAGAAAVVFAGGSRSRPKSNLGALIDEYEQLIRKDDPVSAGQEGDREALRRLPDARPETQAAIAKQLKSIGERLAAINVCGLVRRRDVESSAAHRRRRDSTPSSSHSICRAFRSRTTAAFIHCSTIWRARRPSARVTTRMRGSRDSKRRRRTTSRTSPTCSEASRPNTRNRASWPIGCSKWLARWRTPSLKTARCCCRLRACRRAFRPRRKRNIAPRRSRSCAIASCRRRRSSPTSWKRNISAPRVPSSRGERFRTARAPISSSCDVRPRRR